VRPDCLATLPPAAGHTREELLQPFTDEVYGVIPPPCEDLEFRVTSEGTAFGGLGLRREISLLCRQRNEQQTLRMLLYLPAHAKKPVGVFFGLNFRGNLGVTPDPGVTFIPFQRYGDLPISKLRYHDSRYDESTRGSLADRWEIENTLRRGCAVATIGFFDIYPDRPAGVFQDSVMRLFHTEEEWESPNRASGAISAWAWGVMRGIDCLYGQPEIDRAKIAVLGHSRLGKTALWAGANDPRISLVISNCSGTLGAKLSHRNFGESYEWIDFWNPHWTRASFRKYVRHEELFPVDQHWLMAAIAPRRLMVISATEDSYADPLGEYLALQMASSAWGDGDAMPPKPPPPAQLLRSQAGNLAYYLRKAPHSIALENWNAILDFADF
ncbi:MAG: hypothetical protein IJJ33_21420, partial [Victivallales bacterium]|nr:hypothetical protein [Victivallales bacterium]